MGRLCLLVLSQYVQRAEMAWMDDLDLRSMCISVLQGGCSGGAVHGSIADDPTTRPAVVSDLHLVSVPIPVQTWRCLDRLTVAL